MNIKEQFKGLSANRFDREPLEKRFAEAWQKLNDESVPGRTKPTLAYLMDKDNRGTPDPPLSDRDWLVANTVVQWLGSPVGQSFFTEVICQEEGKPFFAKLIATLEAKDRSESAAD